MSPENRRGKNKRVTVDSSGQTETLSARNVVPAAALEIKPRQTGSMQDIRVVLVMGLRLKLIVPQLTRLISGLKKIFLRNTSLLPLYCKRVLEAHVHPGRGLQVQPNLMRNQSCWLAAGPVQNLMTSAIEEMRSPPVQAPPAQQLRAIRPKSCWFLAAKPCPRKYI